jgi:superfamily II DNA or RNA helicase
MNDNNHIKIELKEYQKIPIEFMKNNKGLILYHSTGSGKTITALLSMNQFKKRIVIIGSKSSKKAFNDDIKKLELNADRFEFFTFSKIKKTMKNTNIDMLHDACVIVDEAHNLRNETIDNMMLITSFEYCYKIILLTATPIINYLNDLSVLVNIVKNSVILPTDIKLFNAAYYDEETGNILNIDTLMKKMNNCISYYNKNENNRDYPSVKIYYKEVEMNNDQIEEYRHYISKFLFDQTIGSAIYTIDFENINQRKKNFFLSSTRQLSNTLNGSNEYPKIKSIFKMIKKGPFPCVIYSNYLKNGVLALSQLLEIDNITYKTITGDTNNEKINMIVNDYNNRKFDVLLITSAGSESLDLKNTRQLHIMEPHWNESRINQVIGRVVRYKSHVNLPQDEQFVTIYRWISVFPTSVNNKSADQYLIELSIKKDKITKQFDDIIKKVSIEKVNNNKQHGGANITNEMNINNYIDNRVIFSDTVVGKTSMMFECNKKTYACLCEMYKYTKSIL